MFPIKDTSPSGKIPFANYAIILICLIVLIYEMFLHSEARQIFFLNYGLVPSYVNSNFSTWWPFITSIFLHGGFMHFFSNMWFLQIFGDNIEDKLGKFKYVLFYLSAGIVAGLTQYLISPHINIPTIGASGAVAAILGFYLIKFPHHTITTYSYYGTSELPAQLILLLWFATQLFNGVGSLATDITGIAWWAHIGGFIYGIVIAKWTRH